MKVCVASCEGSTHDRCRHPCCRQRVSVAFSYAVRAVCEHCELTGDRAVQFLDGGAFQFRGRRIYDAVINSLLAQHGLVRVTSLRPAAHTFMGPKLPIWSCKSQSARWRRFSHDSAGPDSILSHSAAAHQCVWDLPFLRRSDRCTFLRRTQRMCCSPGSAPAASAYSTARPACCRN